MLRPSEGLGKWAAMAVANLCCPCLACNKGGGKCADKHIRMVPLHNLFVACSTRTTQPWRWLGRTTALHQERILTWSSMSWTHTHSWWVLLRMMHGVAALHGARTQLLMEEALALCTCLHVGLWLSCRCGYLCFQLPCRQCICACIHVLEPSALSLDPQMTSTDSVHQATVTAETLTPEGIVAGSKVAISSLGNVSFEGLRLLGPPGAYDMTFSARASLRDLSTAKLKVRKAACMAAPSMRITCCGPCWELLEAHCPVDGCRFTHKGK